MYTIHYVLLKDASGEIKGKVTCDEYQINEDQVSFKTKEGSRGVISRDRFVSVVPNDASVHANG